MKWMKGYRVNILQDSPCRIARFLVVFSTVAWSLMTSAHAETVSPLDSMRGILAQLSVVQRASIDQQCSSAESDKSSINYRQCVQKTLNPSATTDMSQFEALSFDDKYAAQQACATTRRNPNLTYQDCLHLEVAELSLIPAPALANLLENEQYVLRQSCFSTQTESGGAAYRLCMNREIEQLNQVAEVDLSFLSAQDRNAIQMICSPSSVSQSAPAYRQCLARELLESGLARDRSQTAVASTPRSGIVSVSTNPDRQTGNAESTELTATTDNIPATTAAALPETDTSIATPAATVDKRAKKIPVVNPPAPPAENPAIAVSLPTKPSLIESLTGRLPEVSVLLYALPVVLILGCIQLLRVLRRREANEPLLTENTYSRVDLNSESPFGEWDLPEQSTPQAKTADLKSRWILDDDGQDDFLRDAAADNAVTPQQRTTSEIDNDLTIDLDAELNANLDQTILISSDDDETFALSESERMDSINSQHRTHQNDNTLSIGDTLRNATTTDLQPISDFGRHLSQFNKEDRKRQTTEFLLYWTSYGDQNYDPEQAEEILQGNSTNEHDLIKKWVLLKDANALTDALRYLTQDFSEEEVRQTINLLLAVLVQVEPTSVQNTLFRFIADYVGMGSVGLNRQYKYLFNREFPGLPRPDAASWWDQQQHTVAKNENLQLLGLEDDASNQDILQAQAQIEKRFNPALFQQLGEKQQALAARHADRYRRICTELLQEVRS